MSRNLSEMMCLDIYLSSLSNKEYDNIKRHIKPNKNVIMPLLSWDVYSDYNYMVLERIKINRDIETVKAFAKKSCWKNEIDLLFKNQDFEALIITDFDQKIIWVNDGFTEMTGYTKAFARNKKSNFLQGTNTLPDTRNQIRNQLKELKPFTAIITNYRKDKSSYECEVRIIPMYNESVTHFLAIEKLVG